ncbi:hypothetical protein [Hyphococcus sp.]|uniref:hypothetical protein n=1 Tax=Hyphococcus sp. TaxID=2038636 RepID=UPI0020855C81|nr:MAG: hypothetical protein DHS20C04_16750 [Marinicaulis sp.]
MNRDDLKAEQGTVDAAWERATKLFANSRAMRPRLSWLSAVSIDTTANRIQQLLTQRRTIAFHNILAVLDDAAFGSFLQRAEINLERAAAAMRLNLVINISAPVGALVIVNQLFPNFVPNLVEQYGIDAVIVASTSVLFLLLLSMWYCYSGVAQARDLAHLTRLYDVRQKVAVDAPNDFDEEPLNPAELA